MNTTIMDAYRARITSMESFTKFIGDITTAYKYFLLETYAENAKDTIIKLVERLPYLKYTNPERYRILYKRFETKALQSYAKITARKRNSVDPVYPSIDFDTMLHSLPTISVAKAISYKSLNPEQTTAKLYVYPTGNHILIKASGENFKYFMRNMPKELAAKYKIKDWHWQDKYDKPKDVKDFEWQARKRTWAAIQAPWETIEETMSEPGHGFEIGIFDFDKFEEWLASNKSVQQDLDDTIKMRIIADDAEARLETWAYLEARHDYVSEQKYMHEKYEPDGPMPKTLLKILDDRDAVNIQYELAMLFDKNAHIPGSRANEMLVKTKNAMKEYMIDFKASPFRIQSTVIND